MAENHIVFEIAGTFYGVPASQVEMVEMVDGVTPVPNTPEFVEGVSAVRGQVIPVISVRRRFHLPDAGVNLRSRLIVIRIAQRVVGMLVDTAREFIPIAPDQIKPVGDLSGPGTEYLDGVATLDDRLVLLINLERLLSFAERKSIAQVEIATDASDA